MSAASQHAAPVVPPPVRPVFFPPQAKEEAICQWCKEAIAKDALVCPHCKSPRLGAAKFLCAMAVVVAALLFVMVVHTLKPSGGQEVQEVELGGTQDSDLFTPAYFGEPTPPQAYTGESDQ